MARNVFCQQLLGADKVSVPVTVESHDSSLLHRSCAEVTNVGILLKAATSNFNGKLYDKFLNDVGLKYSQKNDQQSLGVHSDHLYQSIKSQSVCTELPGVTLTSHFSENISRFQRS